MVGIGTAGTGSSNEMVDGLGLTAAERKAFLAAGPVGDTCCRFFDADGRPIHGVVHDRVIAIELDELRRSRPWSVWPPVSRRRPGCWAPSVAASSTA